MSQLAQKPRNKSAPAAPEQRARVAAKPQVGAGNHHRQETPLRPALSLSVAPSPMLQRACACGSCDSCKKKKRLLQRSAAGAETRGGIPPVVHQVLAAPGRPLDRRPRNIMERGFGHDFGGVRIHDGAQAAASARAVGAHAYTVGQDVVFAAGRYAPHSTGGQRLLAHELAHTIQQRGLQRSAVAGVALPLAGENERLEREAERAASAMAAGGASPAFAGSLSVPLLSREEDPAAESGAVPAPLRSWQPLETPIEVGGGVQITAHQDSDVGIVAFKVNKFPLPANKGRALETYRAKAAAQALEATIGFTGRSPNAGLWQSRDSTADLRWSWLEKVGWTAENAVGNWHEAGGRPAPAGTSTFSPVLHGGTVCQMDHIVELQLGGTNTRNNIQVLDPAANQQSGRDIWQWVSGLARQARQTLPDPKPDFVLLHFDEIEQQGTVTEFSACSEPGRATKCIDVEACALSQGGAAPASVSGLEDYGVAAGGASDNLHVSASAAHSDLTGGENRASRQIVAGMLLNTLNRGTGGNRDRIDAQFDSDNLIKNARGTRVPIEVTKRPSAIHFAVNPENRNLDLTDPRHPAVDFLYPFLSPGHLDLSYDDDGNLTATGTLTPSLPLLSRAPLRLELSPDRLWGGIRADPKSIRSPIPGLRFTELSLGADLLPEFRPAGRIGFTVGPEGREFLTGLLEATFDNGLVLAGDLFALIPGTDRAQGHVEYRGRQWSGYVVVESSQIRLPGLQRGELRVDFNPDGTIRPSGTVELLIGGNPVTLRAAYENSRLVLLGDATVQVPGLRPVVLNLRRDGERLAGSVRTGVDIGGLSGSVLVNYLDGRISGEGTVALQRGRASGTINLRLSEAGKLFGQGSATIQLTKDLVGTVGIAKPEEGPVRVSGELRFPNPIQLFRAVERSHTLFEHTQEFPIPGLSIPVINAGVIATLTGRLSASYGFGPGTLDDIHATTAFNPLEDNANLEVDAGATLSVPAYANLSLSLRAGAGVSATVANVTVGITATGTAGLRGGFTGAVQFHYANSIYVVDAEAAVRVHPEFSLGLDADVTAEVGAFGYTAARWQKVWNLANFQWGSDMEAGLIANLHYASNEGLTLPSAENIRWIVPPIDPPAVLRDLFGGAPSREKDLP